MKIKIINFCLLLILGNNLFAQDAAKMKKHLTVAITDKYDKTVTISFDPKTFNKHGFEEISGLFKKAFVSKGFNVLDTNSQYVFIMDYEYGYDIGRYRMQYSNLTVNVVDLFNSNSVVATVVYKGRFETDAVAEAVATEFFKTAALANTKNDTKKQTSKTKEERILELKQLYEKQLISKEEYEAAKKKILEE